MDTFHEGFVRLRLSSDQPFLTLSERLVTFSKSAIELLGYAPFVHLSVNREKKELLVEACAQDRYSVAFVREVPKGRQVMVRWAHRDLLDPIRSLLDEPLTEPIRVWGEFYPEHKAIIFDFSDIQPSGKNAPDVTWSVD